MTLVLSAQTLSPFVPDHILTRVRETIAGTPEPLPDELPNQECGGFRPLSPAEMKQLHVDKL